MKKLTSIALTAALCMSSLVSAFPAGVVSAADERTGFVTTNGTQFMLDGSAFYYAGTNNYYLNFKSKFAADNVIEDAAAMGLKVIRTWGGLDCGIKTDEVDANGTPVFKNSIDGGGQKDGVYYQYFDAELNRPVVNEGEDGLQVLDYAIYKASQEDIRLLITFTNNWEAFGGKAQYVQWAKDAGVELDMTGITKPEDAFYVNETIKQWYKDYINTLLNHVNVYTGIAYKDDPTIFSWELMNEPRCPSDENGTKGIFKDWATEMSEYVKSIDQNHMLAAGDEGFYCYDRQERTDLPSGQWMYFGTEGIDWNTILEIPDIDYGTVHIYCDQWGLTEAEDADRWFTEHAESAAAANKPWIIEEFGWADKETRTEKYEDWFSIFEGTKYDGVETAGTNYWMIASTMDDGKLYPDYDGYTVYYQDSAGDVNAATRDAVMAHAERMDAKNSLNSVSPKKAGFDIVNPADLALTANLTSGSLTGVTLDGTALSADMYTIAENRVTISADALSALELGAHKLILNTTEGNEPSAVITVFDSNAEKENARIIDTFEGYDDTQALAAAYLVNSAGAPVAVSLDSETAAEGTYSMKYAYDVESNSYCGVTKALKNADWSAFDGISFKLYADGSDRDVTIQFVDGAGAYWESIQKVTAQTGWVDVKIPFTDFNNQSWGTAADSITRNGVTQFSIYAGQNGNPGKGVWYFDDITLYSEASNEDPAPSVVNASADYTMGSEDSVFFTINTNGTQFLSLTDADGNVLAQGTDFSVNGSQYRINTTYLAGLPEGTHTLTAAFSGDHTLTLTIHVLSTEPSENPSEEDTTAPTDSDVKLGDVNEDGEIDILDVILLNKNLLGSTKLTEQGKRNADVDQNTKVDTTDSLTILKYVVKILDSFDKV